MAALLSRWRSGLRGRRRGRPDGDGAATLPPGFPSVASLAAPPETPPLAPLLTRRQRPTQTSRKPLLLRPRIQRTAARDPGGTNGTRIYQLRRDRTGQVLFKSNPVWSSSLAVSLCLRTLSPQALKPHHLPHGHSPVPQALGNVMVLLALVMRVLVVVTVMSSGDRCGTCYG